MNNEYKVVLIDYDDDLFTPIGFEATMLAEVNASWSVNQCREADKIVELAHDADVVMIQSVRPLLTHAVIEKLEKCRCIIRLGIGYDTVDMQAAVDNDILVCNIPYYCVEDVAEHALALIFDSMRHTSLQDRWIREGKWDRRGARPARRFRSSTLGLVSFGRIARALARRAKGLGANVIAFDPFVNSKDMDEFDVKKVGLDELLRDSDFVSVHTPLVKATHHLIGKREFELMKPGSIIVNTSRGPVVDNQALVEALKSGKLWGAGLDVMEQEPLPKDSSLLEIENLIMTPHVGASTEQSTEELYRDACQIACDVISGKFPNYVVSSGAKEMFEAQLC